MMVKTVAEDLVYFLPDLKFYSSKWRYISKLFYLSGLSLDCDFIYLHYACTLKIYIHENVINISVGILNLVFFLCVGESDLLLKWQ